MDCHSIFANVEEIKMKTTDAGVHCENDLDTRGLTAIADKYVKSICHDMTTRFSDDVSMLCTMQNVYSDKNENPDFTHIAKAKLFNTDMQAEWKILRRLPHDMSTQAAMIDLATSVEKKTMFPTMSLVTRRILLLPIYR